VRALLVLTWALGAFKQPSTCFRKDELYHNIIVIGTSAREIPPLEGVLRGLPGNLLLALLVEVHYGADASDEVMNCARRLALSCVLPCRSEPILSSQILSRGR
jgi:hypothetical protein